MAQKCTPDTFTVSSSSLQKYGTSPTELPAVFCTSVCLTCACHEPSSTMVTTNSACNVAESMNSAAQGLLRGAQLIQKTNRPLKYALIRKTSCNEITKWRSKEKINP